MMPKFRAEGLKSLYIFQFGQYTALEYMLMAGGRGREVLREGRWSGVGDVPPSQFGRGGPIIGYGSGAELTVLALGD